MPKDEDSYASGESSIYGLSEDNQALENEIEEINGSMPEGHSAGDGTGPADAKQRRIDRGFFAREDYEPPIDLVESYTGPKSGAEVRTFEQLEAHARYRENLAREAHTDYDEIISKYIEPYVQREIDAGTITQEDVRQWLLRDDCAEAAYQVGRAERDRIRGLSPTRDEIGRMSVPEFEEVLRKVRDRQSQQEEPERESEALSRRDMKRKNRLSLKDFEKELDADKQRGQ
jgi:hypothetical protein